MTVVSVPDAPLCDQHAVPMLATYTSGRFTGWICPEPHLPVWKGGKA